MHTNNIITLTPRWTAEVASHHMYYFSWFMITVLFIDASLLCDIRYVENNPQYAESNVYLVKFRQLQVCNTLFLL